MALQRRYIPDRLKKNNDISTFLDDQKHLHKVPGVSPSKDRHIYNTSTPMLGGGESRVTEELSCGGKGSNE